MINQMVLQGNAGNDPEIKFVKDNLAVASVSIAHTPRTQKNGRWEDGETMWVKVVQFGEKAEALVDAVKKGDSVIVTGALKQVSYKGRDGQEKQGLEINASTVSIAPRAPKKREDLPSW
jgi:single-strand DNA-binding protein